MRKILMAIMMVTSMTMMPAAVQAKKISMGRFVLTAYCPCEECSEGYGRKCAKPNTYARSEHTVAVDPSVINLGDTLLINGKKYVAEDTGGKVTGEKIDIFFDTHEEVESFGVKHGDVTIVR
jgi:3D (Asp-Asp-Asp) domain-containing protein